MKRLDYIDISKGIAIILVVLGHCLTWNDSLRYGIYAFHIPLFYIINGLTQHIKRSGGGYSLKKDLIRTGCIYIVYSILFVGYDLLRVVITERDFIYSIANDVALTVSGYGINVLWFFSGMIGAKLLYAISYKIKGKPPVPVFVVYLILGCVSILISGAIAGFLQGKFLVRCVGYVATAFLRSFTIVPFLAFGDLFGYKIAAWVKKKSIVISGLFVLTALIPALLRMKVTLVLNCSEPFFATYLFALPISVGVLGLSQKITEMKSFSSILRWFGKNSLFVMVIHEYTSVRSTIQQMVVCVVQPYWIQILLTLVFVLLACFLLRKILNQPYQMIMKRIDVFASEHMKTNIVE